MINKNDFIGIFIYAFATVFLGYKIAFLILFIKENSDRCHYYNGKWNKKDLILGCGSILIGFLVKRFLL